MIITFKVDCRLSGDVDPFKVAIRIMEHIPPAIYSGEADGWEAWVQNVETVRIENNADDEADGRVFKRECPIIALRDTERRDRDEG
jgi:hypothetical protein